MKYPDMTWSRMQAVIDKLGGIDGVQRFLSGELVVKAAGILKQVVTVTVAGATKFIAADHFKVGTTKGVKIAWLSDNFKQLFLGKTEVNVESTTLNVYELTKNSLDAPILAELGDRAETSLAHLWALLAKQPNGESGPLLTKSYANIFYVRGTDDNLWAVSAHWYSDGWSVDAHSVENPGEWLAGYRVFSR